jgi:hypothetical protein
MILLKLDLLVEMQINGMQMQSLLDLVLVVSLLHDP